MTADQLPHDHLAPGQSPRAYLLTGTILEACNCNVLCPCWIGEDPDQGSCDAIVAYHIEQGEITGLDVSGLTVIEVTRIPGNVLAGGWQQLLLVSEEATPAQRQALADAFEGRLGGPLADLAGLVGERLGLHSAPIAHRLVGGEAPRRDGAVQKRLRRHHHPP
jgi:hypothetical protein